MIVTLSVAYGLNPLAVTNYCLFVLATGRPSRLYRWVTCGGTDSTPLSRDTRNRRISGINPFRVDPTGGCSQNRSCS